MVTKKTIATLVAAVMALALVIAPVLGLVEDGSNGLIEPVYATGLEDNVGGGSSSDFGSQIKDQELDSNTEDVMNFFKGQPGVTGEQLDTVSRTLSPVLTLLGYVTGAILILTIAGVTVITALDLLYITIPPIRNLLYKAGTDGTGGYTGGFGAGGYGRGFGGFGAMGAGGAAAGTAKPTQWVSDEAVACAAMIGGSAQAGGMPGMGMGAGMGMGMGAGMGAPAQPVKMRSVIATYFKKRVVFMVLLGVCIIVLTSSILMDTGINLAKWIMKIVAMLNGYME